jgi:hypothetical protein
MGRVFVATLVGAIVSFVWGAVSWMVLDWHRSTVRAFDNEEAVAKAIGGSAKEHGVYLLPNWMGKPVRTPTQETQAAEQRAKVLRQAGPTLFAIVRPGPRQDRFGMDLTFAYAFLRSLGACFIVALLVRQTKRLDYIQKVGFCVLCGIFAGLATDVPMLIWFEAPLRYTLIHVADHLCEWFLVGLVIGALVEEREAY